MAQGGFGAVHTLLGLIVCRWLWGFGRVGRSVGVLFLLLGLNHLPFAIWGEPAAPVQTASTAPAPTQVASAERTPVAGPRENEPACQACFEALVRSCLMTFP